MKYPRSAIPSMMQIELLRVDQMVQRTIADYATAPFPEPEHAETAC